MGRWEMDGRPTGSAVAYTPRRSRLPARSVRFAGEVDLPALLSLSTGVLFPVDDLYGKIDLPIPSFLIAFIFLSTLASVIGITIYVSKHTSGEISEFGTHRSLWRI